MGVTYNPSRPKKTKKKKKLKNESKDWKENELEKKWAMISPSIFTFNLMVSKLYVVRFSNFFEIYVFNFPQKLYHLWLEKNLNSGEIFLVIKLFLGSD